MQSEVGSCSVTGRPGPPAKPGIPLADVGAGMYAYSSVLAALYDRERTGRGTAISVPSSTPAAEWMGYPLHYTLGTGREQEPQGVGSPAVAPYGAYPTADGEQIVLGTTNDAEWQRLATRRCSVRTSRRSRRTPAMLDVSISAPNSMPSDRRLDAVA